MSNFTENTYISPLPKANKWITTKILVYYVGEEDSDDIITVPDGFEFDGASIPYIFGRFAQKVEPRTIGPACIHDFLYITKSRSRREADDIFFEALLVMGVNTLKAFLYWIGVRIGGWYVWNKGLKKVLSSDDYI